MLFAFKSGMTRYLWYFFIISQLLVFELTASTLCRHFYANTYQIDEVIVSWYRPIDFGDNEMIGGFVNKQRVLKVLIPQANNYPYYQDFGNPRILNFDEMGYSVKFMPGSAISGSHYYAVESIIPEHFLPHMGLLTNSDLIAKYRAGEAIPIENFNSSEKPKKNALLKKSMIDLYNSSNLNEIEKLVSYDLTWETYRQEGTVKESDIESFKATEKNLDPRRKITFELSVPEIRNNKLHKKTLSIMRVYDGSTFPTSSYSDFPTHHEAIKTDPRVPLERRYPEINFRTDNDFIFEPGRLAKSNEIEGSLIEYQFYSLGQYLLGKFGFKGIGPGAYFKKGKIVIEITGRNLEKFMRTRKNNGFGFTLDYIVEPTKEGHKIIKTDQHTTYESLQHSFKETETKFILHSTVADFINNFIGGRIGSPEEVLDNK